MFNLEQSIAEWRKQMLAAGIKTPVPLEELELHLREEIERQMKSGLSGQKSFDVSVEKIGCTQTLKSEFKKNETKGNYMINHNRTYSIILAALAFYSATSGGLCLFLAGLRTTGQLGINIPAWSLPWVAVLNFVYAMAVVVALFARQYRPQSGRRLTRILNWALLPALPGGTIVGIYGLWMVDKERKQYV